MFTKKNKGTLESGLLIFLPKKLSQANDFARAATNKCVF